MSICISSRDILYTQHELIEVEWLHEIVICTEGEPFDLIELLRERCQKEEWYTDTSSTEHTDERESIDVWHHTIDDEEVVLLSSYHIESHLAMIRDGSIVSFIGQIERDIFCDSMIIIDDEYMHERILVEELYRLSIELQVTSGRISYRLHILLFSYWQMGRIASLRSSCSI